ncbi:NmrA family NAD(P)-binding protein [Microvirga pakistanensis]|uniref:NmrA family NAD(P)-binding protein n=1 Tax=Microvirga pakistanensis TaxID=1682650 RepID=UPI00106C6943|nr:NmrA family NAD(P)-binding protein [Microvirga pakistanensis]
MFVIIGGTGHVGSATATELLRRSETVAIVTRYAAGAADWHARGAEVIEADVEDVPSLRKAFQRGKRALLLNPPADPAKDTDAVERRTVANIIAALDGSGLEKVVAASTGGAQPGVRLGDLSVLWGLEEGLRRQGIPAAINRGAYYMSNWDGLLDVVRRDGVLPTMLPADLPIPMVAPHDLGQAAAERLLSSVEDIGIRYIEGPRRYSPAEVAEAFSNELGRPVRLSVIPRENWKDTFLQLGFSEAAATSYTRMTEVSVDRGFDLVENPWRGSTSLEAYIHELVARSASRQS